MTTPQQVDPPVGYPRIRPHLIYDDVGAAVETLTDLFGFQERRLARQTSSDGTIGRTQMQVVDSVITLGLPSIHGDSPRNGVSSMLYVYVDDVDGHYEHARTAGANIVTGLANQPWGDRCYQAGDPQGHQWSFARNVAPPDPQHNHADALTDEEVPTTSQRINPPLGYPRILPHLIYDDVGAAVQNLTALFGFQERTFARHTSPHGTIGRTQLKVVDSVITLGLPSIHGDSPRNGVSSLLHVYVDDVDRHYERAKKAGAEMVAELENHWWGDRCYQARDLEGHQWTFAQRVGSLPSVETYTRERGTPGLQ